MLLEVFGCAGGWTGAYLGGRRGGFAHCMDVRAELLALCAHIIATIQPAVGSVNAQ